MLPLNWQLHLSHPRKKKKNNKMNVFKYVSIFSLHLLGTFLYRDIKDGQRLERVWTDITTPTRRILLRREVRSVCQENPCQEELLPFCLESVLHQHSTSNSNSASLQGRRGKGLELVLETTKGRKQSSSGVQI